MAETKKKATKAKTTSDDKSPGTTTAGRGLRKTQEGIVVSSKMDKTIVVATVRQVRHAAYGKFVRKTKKFYAHDEANQSGVGDCVRIVETRPLSKLKCWKLETILRKAE